MPRVSRSRASKPTASTLRRLEARIAATDSRIDAFVCDFYDLAADEIALVEASRPPLRVKTTRPTGSSHPLDPVGQCLPDRPEAREGV
ncbi:MAG: hypothetical protein WD342_18270 [Verrucomicrobiales bacterium]